MPGTVQPSNNPAPESLVSVRLQQLDKTDTRSESAREKGQHKQKLAEKQKGEEGRERACRSYDLTSFTPVSSQPQKGEHSTTHTPLPRSSWVLSLNIMGQIPWSHKAA